MIEVAIEPKTKGDQEKLGTAIQRLSDEDPTFTVKTDEETGQTIIAGMGELHLEILVDRMKREFRVEATVGKPQVAYRETIRGTVGEPQLHPQEADRWVRPVRQGAHHASSRTSTRRPARARATSSSTTSAGGRVPREYIPSVDQGGQDAMEFGVLAGYPMVDVKFTLEDGAYHDVDSSELAFKIAGNQAFKEAARKAKPVLLEPMFAVEVITPETFLGDVIGDINSRRGQIQAWRSVTATCRQRPCAAVRDVRVRWRPEVEDLRSGVVLDGVRLVRRGSHEHRRRDHQEGPRRVDSPGSAAPAPPVSPTTSQVTTTGGAHSG